MSRRGHQKGDLMSQSKESRKLSSLKSLDWRIFTTIQQVELMDPECLSPDLQRICKHLWMCAQIAGIQVRRAKKEKDQGGLTP